eukprot:jgi/Botrbrau1/12119/Bobra.0186s0037.1
MGSLLVHVFLLWLVIHKHQLFIARREPFIMFVWFSDLLLLTRSQLCIKMALKSSLGNLFTFLYILVAKWSVFLFYLFSFRVVIQCIPLVVYPCLLMLHFNTPQMFLPEMADNWCLKRAAQLADTLVTALRDLPMWRHTSAPLEGTRTGMVFPGVTEQQVIVVLWWLLQCAAFWWGYRVLWRYEMRARQRFLLRFREEFHACRLLDMTEQITFLTMFLGELVAMASGAVAHVLGSALW